ncbi:MAG TPA: poly-A polymerase [Leptospiraceae bacterium]|nr:poly-A polymerase [Leptospiraceae bacterium]HMY65641.1 poly-A polymerase [Leptospiraceae bacterium]HMZ57812.1 poly-A polymerase [Leptospiraceae bacterium]HNF17170.1 poly-A polymerase [Leptospiraceae bacterium]HNM06098.1 poly-A polymerase [Leptospiraceae bacterium]
MKKISTEQFSLIDRKNQENLEKITSVLNEAGYECYLIGGSVRDMLMNRVPHEYDLAVSAEPEEVKKLFRKVIETGLKHGTVTVLIDGFPYELTTFRKDIDYIDGRHPERVEFGATLSEDMKRRDFTMNAIALNIRTGDLTDENEGISDIHKKIIRTIGNAVERFTEDGLRPIRAIRFQSSLDFTIEEETYKAIAKTRHITAKISTERFHDEFIKILKTEKPGKAVIELIRNRIFSLFWGDISEKETESVMNLDSLPNVLNLRLAYFYDTQTDSEKKWEILENSMKRLRFSNEKIRESSVYIRSVNEFQNIEYMDDYGRRKFLSFLSMNIGKKNAPVIIENLKHWWLLKNVRSHETLAENLKKELSSDAALLLSDLKINGDILSSRFPNLPKKEYGTILKSSLDYILKHPEKNTEKDLLEFISKISG